jgi:cytochrome c553
MNSTIKLMLIWSIVIGSVAACLAFICSAPALAAEAAGKKKADEACAACHGPEGNKPVTPDTPRLAGQEYAYLIHALGEYRNGKRDNAVMAAMAKPLSESEVHELASYFSMQTGLSTKR